MNDIQDREKLLHSIKDHDSRFDQRGNRVLIALREYQNDFPVDQTCLKCGEIIAVTGLGSPVCAWGTDCKCHECKSTFRGL
jgi:hypothetical protein